MYKTLKDIFLITLITAALIEAVGLMVKSNDYFWEYRNLFISRGSFRSIEESGLWTYKPDSMIMSASAYHFFGIGGWIEYRCTFKTNKFGLIDTNYDGGSAVEYLVLGDSFTEGQGGCPWLTRTSLQRADLPTIINAGLQGIGIQQMEKTEVWLEKQVSIKNIVLIVISNDFKRPLPPTPWMNGQEACLNDGRCDSRNFWWSVGADISNEELYQLSQKRASERSTPLLTKADAALSFHSFTYNVVKKVMLKLFPQRSPIDWKTLHAEFLRSFDSLDRLSRRFPNLMILFVPQRDEVGLLGIENLDTKIVKNFLEANSYNWKQCDLTIDDYMRIDGHPNQRGYGKIFSCLSSMIKSSYK